MSAPSPASSDVPVHCCCSAMVPLHDLRANPANPQKHPERQLAIYIEVLRAHGWRRCITISRRSGLIVRGHGALLAARRLGLTAAPVEYQDYESDAAELADLLADNRLPALATTDKAMLAVIFQQLGASSDNVETGYSGDEIAALVNEILPEPEYPITARLNERHDYLVIFCDSETDFQFLKNLCGVRTERSYKNTNVSEGRAIPFDRFLAALRENSDSLAQASRPDHHPSAA